MQTTSMNNMRAWIVGIGILVAITITLANLVQSKGTSQPVTAQNEKLRANEAQATFSMGCFWHSEEIFLEIKGVISATPGYCGGTEKNPSYELVSSGSTNYAESVNVTFDTTVISYQKLLEVFFAEHDPTTVNAQYPDVGPQYRSAIFTHSQDQAKEAVMYVAKLTFEHKYKSPIVTQINSFVNFYPAEDYHIHYYRNHPDQPYIASVTREEVEKFRHDFPELLKQD